LVDKKTNKQTKHLHPKGEKNHPGNKRDVYDKNKLLLYIKTI